MCKALSWLHVELTKTLVRKAMCALWCDESNVWQWRPIALPLKISRMTFSKDMLVVAEIDNQEKRKHTNFSNLTTSSVMFLKGKCYRWGTEEKKSGYIK